MCLTHLLSRCNFHPIISAGTLWLSELVRIPRDIFVLGAVMAIFEKDVSGKTYIALLDKDGNMVAFLSPVKGISNELLVESLQGRGLNVELRESKPELTSLDL